MIAKSPTFSLLFIGSGLSEISQSPLILDSSLTSLSDAQCTEMLLSLEEESIMVGRFAGRFLKREDFALLPEVAIFFERFAGCFCVWKECFLFPACL